MTFPPFPSHQPPMVSRSPLKTLQRQALNTVRSVTLFGLMGFGLMGVTLVSLGGCNSLEKRIFKPEMTLKVEATGSTGVFLLKGRTNLPQPEVEKRKQPIVITVQAVRQLLPKAGAKTLKNLKPVNAIVARQRLESVDGNWEVKLNLLQPSDQGKPLEVWQLNPNDFPKDLEPSPTVTFLAATESIDRTLEFSPDVTKTGADGQKPVLQSAIDGSLFLQAEESRNIAPPTLPKVAEKAAPRIVKVTAQSISEKRTPLPNKAPLSSPEFVR